MENLFALNCAHRPLKKRPGHDATSMSIFFNRVRILNNAQQDDFETEAFPERLDKIQSHFRITCLTKACLRIVSSKTIPIFRATFPLIDNTAFLAFSSGIEETSTPALIISTISPACRPMSKESKPKRCLSTALPFGPQWRMSLYTRPIASGTDEIYGFNIGVAFDDPNILYAELFGRYVWWDTKKIPDAEYDTFIWDLNVKKRMYSSERASLDLFVTGHNIFSGSHYLAADSENPARWLEAGLKMEF